MVQIVSKKIVKVFSVMIAALVMLGAALLFTACETNYPQIKMTVEFNEKSYELTYKLYRKMYPNTVAHYLELIDDGFYNETVIHDYQDAALFGGSYKMVDTDEYLSQIDYEAFVSEHALKNVTVWRDSNKDNALNTLVGEFSKNGYVVENNGLSHVTGSLSTYYNLDTSTSENLVYTALAAGSGKQYKYNCTTSQFMIMRASNSSYDANYCTFGVLADSKNEDRFNELLTAITDYIEEQSENDENYSFTE